MDWVSIILQVVSAAIQAIITQNQAKVTVGVDESKAHLATLAKLKAVEEILKA